MNNYQLSQPKDDTWRLDGVYMHANIPEGRLMNLCADTDLFFSPLQRSTVSPPHTSWLILGLHGIPGLPNADIRARPGTINGPRRMGPAQQILENLSAQRKRRWAVKMAVAETSDRLSAFLSSGIYRLESCNAVFIDPVRVLNRSYSRFRVSPSMYYSRFFDSKHEDQESRFSSNSRKRKRKEKQPHALNERERSADERHQVSFDLWLVFCFPENVRRKINKYFEFYSSQRPNGGFRASSTIEHI